MRVWVLHTDGFGGHGGIALYNRQLLQALSNHSSIQKVVAFPRVPPQFDQSIPEKVEFRSDVAGSKLRYLYAILKAFSEGSRPDFVVCGHINLLPAASVLVMTRTIPLVLILHGLEGWSKVHNPLVRLSLKRVSRILCVSSVTRDRFLRWAHVPAGRVQVILNGIDLSKFVPGEKPRYLLERYGLTSEKIIMTMGRVMASERAKGFDQVLEVMPRILAKQPDVRYLIVGDGSDLVRLKEKACQLGIKEAVIFAGQIVETEKADHYRVADAYVMPSRWEGFGFVYLEALACGIPVVGSRADGSRDALKNGILGILVDPDNEEELIFAIQKALLKKKEVPSCLQELSFERYEKELHEVIDALFPLNKV